MSGAKIMAQKTKIGKFQAPLKVTLGIFG